MRIRTRIFAAVMALSAFFALTAIAGAQGTIKVKTKDDYKMHGTDKTNWSVGQTVEFKLEGWQDTRPGKIIWHLEGDDPEKLNDPNDSEDGCVPDDSSLSLKNAICKKEYIKLSASTGRLQILKVYNNQSMKIKIIATKTFSDGITDPEQIDEVEITAYPKTAALYITDDNGLGGPFTIDYHKNGTDFPSITLKAHIEPEDSTNGALPRVIWKSSNNNIAQVDPVTGTETNVIFKTDKIGQAVTITATTDDGSRLSSKTVVALGTPATKIKIFNPDGVDADDDPTYEYAREGQSYQFTARVYPANASTGIVWHVGDECEDSSKDISTDTCKEKKYDYAEISNTGVLTIKDIDKATDFYVWATTANGVTDKSTITVLESTKIKVTAYPTIERIWIEDDNKNRGSLDPNSYVYGNQYLYGRCVFYIDSLAGNSINLEVKTDPENAELMKETRFVWTCSNPKIAKVTTATVKDTTKATVKFPIENVTGTVTITATAKDGSGMSASAIVTYGNPGVDKVDTGNDSGVSIEIVDKDTPSSSNMEVGQTKRLYTKITPGNASNRKVYWTIADDGSSTCIADGTLKATISNNGQLKVSKNISGGDCDIQVIATIKETLTYDTWVESDPLIVTVKPQITGLTIENSSGPIVDADGNPKILRSDSDTSVTLSAKDSDGNDVTDVKWESSDKKIATVDASGVVTPLKPGTVTITATSLNDKKVKASQTIQFYIAGGNLVITCDEKADGDELSFDEWHSCEVTVDPYTDKREPVQWSVSATCSSASYIPSSIVTITETGKLYVSNVLGEDLTVTVSAASTLDGTDLEDPSNPATADFTFPVPPLSAMPPASRAAAPLMMSNVFFIDGQTVSVNLEDEEMLEELAGSADDGTNEVLVEAVQAALQSIAEAEASETVPVEETSATDESIFSEAEEISEAEALSQETESTETVSAAEAAVTEESLESEAEEASVSVEDSPEAVPALRIAYDGTFTNPEQLTAIFHNGETEEDVSENVTWELRDASENISITETGVLFVSDFAPAEATVLVSFTDAEGNELTAETAISYEGFVSAAEPEAAETPEESPEESAVDENPVETEPSQPTEDEQANEEAVKQAEALNNDNAGFAADEANSAAGIADDAAAKAAEAAENAANAEKAKDLAKGAENAASAAGSAKEAASFASAAAAKAADAAALASDPEIKANAEQAAAAASEAAGKATQAAADAETAAKEAESKAIDAALNEINDAMGKAQAAVDKALVAVSDAENALNDAFDAMADDDVIAAISALVENAKLSCAEADAASQSAIAAMPDQLYTEDGDPLPLFASVEDAVNAAERATKAIETAESAANSAISEANSAKSMVPAAPEFAEPEDFGELEMF